MLGAQTLKYRSCLLDQRSKLTRSLSETTSRIHLVVAVSTFHVNEHLLLMTGCPRFTTVACQRVDFGHSLDCQDKLDAKCQWLPPFLYQNGEYSIYDRSLACKFDLSYQAAPGWRALCAMSPDEGANQLFL